jgi:hypothetical protein
MKVTELFEAQGAPGQGGKLKGGAYYKPAYDEDKKMLLGSVLDWMDAAGISKDDIKQAVTKIKQSPIVDKLEAAGMKLLSKPDSEKRGTLSFEVERNYPSGKPYKTMYQIYANGQIRYSGTSPYAEYQGKLKSPKPRFKAGDPVGSLVRIYTDAMEEVLAKWLKNKKKEEESAEDRMDPHAQAIFDRMDLEQRMRTNKKKPKYFR